MRWWIASLSLVALGCSSNGSPAQNDGGGADVKPTPDAGGRDVGRPDTGSGGDTGGGGDGGNGGDAATDAPPAYPAAHPSMPQVVNLGGPVMKAPKFVVITFAGDSLAGKIDDFSNKVAKSKTYWSGTTKEYGVGPVASVETITVNETPAATLSDGQVQAWLRDKLAGPDAGTLEGGAPWPAPDGETLYVIYYPDNVTITQGGGASCSAFYGYHGDFDFTGKTFVTYSVIARCAPFPMTSAIDSVTSIASHELIEAATDPLALDNPAWAQPDAAHSAWALPAGGELGDMCAGFGDVFYKPADVPYLVQRSWSNAAAAAGHDPCQPDGAMPYFNSAAVVGDTITDHDPVFGTFTTKGIKIPLGNTRTVELDLYSDAPTAGPWTVQAFDLSSLFGGKAELAATFGGKSMATGKNGDKLSLDVKVLAAGQGGTELLWIQSSLGSQSVWLALVGN